MHASIISTVLINMSCDMDEHIYGFTSNENNKFVFFSFAVLIRTNTRNSRVIHEHPINKKLLKNAEKLKASFHTQYECMGRS